MNSRDPLTVALDIGTGSVRAHLMDCSGGIVKTAGRPVQVLVEADGRAEVDPETIWKSVCQCVPEILAGTLPSRIAAVGLASALGYLLLDGKGHPITPALLWMDRRAPAEAAYLASRIDENRLYQITGRRLDPEIFLAKLLWIRKNEPEKFSKASCFLGIKDDLIRRLTGTIGSDPTHASYSMLYDVVRRKWSEEILKVAGIARTFLPELRRADEIAGRISQEGAEATGLPQGIPVLTGASDGTVASLAAGIAEGGTAVNVTGTSDVLMIAADRPLLDSGRRTLLNPHPISEGWMVGGVMGTTGGALKWFVEKFCPDLTGPDRYRILDQEAERAGTGAHGLIGLTGLSGERAPLWNPAARGVLFGLDLRHGRGEVARAILESVALMIREMVEVLEGMGVGVKRLQVVGGGAVSNLWNQIRADATGLSVARPELTEGTATGIALLTGLGMGWYADLAEAARRIAPVERVFEPNPLNRAFYDHLAGLRRSLYEGIRGPFQSLEEFRIRTQERETENRDLK
jgi:sugar (pentulose or hexulose) kinase